MKYLLNFTIKTIFPFTLKKLECLKQAIEKIHFSCLQLLNTLAWDNKIGLDIDLCDLFGDNIGEKFVLDGFSI